MFVFIPKRSADDLRHHLIDYKAASATLGNRGVPNNPEGEDAKKAMETTKQAAESRIGELLKEAFSGARVFQGGGNEILGNTLQDTVLEAAGNALQRLYPHFSMADHAGWGRVYNKAKQGSPDALKAVGYDGEPAKNPVCKAILAYIAGGKKGAEIRSRFESAPYGWPGDAVDGGLQVLLISGLVRGQDERARPLDPRELERKAVGKATFKVESTTVSASQRIQIRKVLQRLGVTAKQGEELDMVPKFLELAVDLAGHAGGEAPKPEPPDTTFLEDIRFTSGNEQLLAIFNQSDELKSAIETWEDRVKRIDKRWPIWIKLQDLLKHAGELKAAEEVRQQTKAIAHQRLLLADPDPVQPLLKSLEAALRGEITDRQQVYDDKLIVKTSALENDSSWQQLSEDEQSGIFEQCGIQEIPKIPIGTHQELVSALADYPLAGWRDRIDALPGRFARARELAARAVEPEVQTVDLPRRTLKTSEDVDNWLADVSDQLKKAVASGPVVIR